MSRSSTLEVGAHLQGQSCPQQSAPGGRRARSGPSSSGMGTSVGTAFARSLSIDVQPLITSSRLHEVAAIRTRTSGWPASAAISARATALGSSVVASGTMVRPIRGHLKAGYRALNPRMRVRALPPELCQRGPKSVLRCQTWQTYRTQNRRSSTSSHEVICPLACKLHSLHTPLSSTRCAFPMSLSGGSKTPTTSSAFLRLIFSHSKLCVNVSHLCNTASRCENRTLTTNLPALPAVPSTMLAVFSVHCLLRCDGRWCAESQSCTGSVAWSNAGHSTCLIGGSNPSPCSKPFIPAVCFCGERQEQMLVTNPGANGRVIGSANLPDGAMGRGGSKLPYPPSCPCSSTAATTVSTTEDERSNRSGGASVKSGLHLCGRVVRCLIKDTRCNSQRKQGRESTQ